ncbi:MAG: HAD family hydrolase [Chloroflexota bacterium]|nr:HAD family hydrolase [Chloroflexota bacterium]
MRERQPLQPLPRLILFDLDDTLCDYGTARLHRLKIAFTLHQRPNGAALHGVLPTLADETLERMVQESIAMQPHGADHFPVIMAKYGITSEPAAAAAMLWYRSHPFHNLKLFPDAVPVIQALRGGGGDGSLSRPRTIGIVTNGPAEVQREKVRLLNLLDNVDFVVISGEFGTWKPDRLIFEEALRLGGADAREAVFIGDSIDHDMIGAAQAGIRTVWLDRGSMQWPTDLAAADRVAQSLTDLLPILRPGSTRGVTVR